jgi:hypothetical protein
MRNLNNWSDFIHVHCISNINHCLLVQGGRLRLLTCVTVLDRKYGNSRSCIGCKRHNTGYSNHRLWSKHHTNSSLIRRSSTIHLPMAFGPKRHLRIGHNRARDYRDTNSVPNREHLLLLYSYRRILFHPVVLNRLGLCQSHSSGGSSYAALPCDRQRSVDHSNSESIGGNGSVPLPVVLKRESSMSRNTCSIYSDPAHIALN